MTREELREYILRNKHASKIELIGKDIKELAPEIGEMNNLRSLILLKPVKKYLQK